ncbi:Pvc16 family protein [Krasilnikovia sp. MM14-A1004]|uniref:Pvc16 family protein n=1 Tax=Krasilnikovia sp. MM14-A1004 TaxID=3373541 RepID=UPI00399D2FFF
MIADVNKALRGLLTPLLPDTCEVRFGVPAPPGAETGPDRPALVWFLAGVREDEKAAETDWEDLRDGDGRVVARRPPVRRFDLHYLVTAEAADPGVEAALLDAVLVAVDPGRRVAPELLGEAMAGRPVTLRLGEYAIPAQPVRTTLSVVASAPLVLPPVTDIAGPADNIRLGVAPPGRPDPAPSRPRRTGRWSSAAIDEESPT